MILNYLKAARIRTLPLSISGIIVGSVLGILHEYNSLKKNYLGVSDLEKDTFFSLKNIFLDNWIIFLLAILTTIGFQVLSNFANDYGDGVKGTDNNRIGEQRLVASGVITPKQMKTAMVFTAISTLIIALLLIYVSFGKENFGYSILFFVLGIAAITAAIKYTVGTSAYGYSGFGDVFVFLFFGLLSVVGSYFLYTKHINFTIFLPAFSIGLLSTAVLNLNNMRDIENDTTVNKNTLVVKIGAKKAKKYHYSLVVFALIFALVYVGLDYHNPQQFLFLIAFIPLFKHLIFISKTNQASLFDGELKKVALSTFLFAILFGLGQVL